MPPTPPALPTPPSAPSVQTPPAPPLMPDVPAVPAAPDAPELPAIPELPDVPAVSDKPAMPAMPTMPKVPAPAPKPVAEPKPAPAPKSVTEPQPAKESQELKDQNIFFLLGVHEAQDDEKEQFLDELQQVIWEDFIESDVELLITDAEMAELEKIMNKGDNEAVQEEMIVYLEKLIPDLEEIMLEKAMELKGDLVRERVAGMKEFFADKPEEIAKLNEAEELINQSQWRKAAELMNSL